MGLNNVPLKQAGTLKPASQTAIGLYLQDKWQITPRLTLTYGLRWDGTINPSPQTPFPGNETYTGVWSNTRIIPNPSGVPNDFKQWGPRTGLRMERRLNRLSDRNSRRVGLVLRSTPHDLLADSWRWKDNGPFLLLWFELHPATCVPLSVPTDDLVGDQSALQYADRSNGVIYGCPGPNIVDPGFQNPRISNLTGSVEHVLLPQLDGDCHVCMGEIFAPENGRLRFGRSLVSELHD